MARHAVASCPLHSECDLGPFTSSPKFSTWCSPRSKQEMSSFSLRRVPRDHERPHSPDDMPLYVRLLTPPPDPSDENCAHFRVLSSPRPAHKTKEPLLRPAPFSPRPQPPSGPPPRLRRRRGPRLPRRPPPLFEFTPQAEMLIFPNLYLRGQAMCPPPPTPSPLLQQSLDSPPPPLLKRPQGDPPADFDGRRLQLV